MCRLGCFDRMPHRDWSFAQTYCHFRKCSSHSELDEIAARASCHQQPELSSGIDNLVAQVAEGAHPARHCLRWDPRARMLAPATPHRLQALPDSAPSDYERIGRILRACSDPLMRSGKALS
mmetsp:Transcript_25394/g.57414  ORF Transcript_25394/g.57414 Transcript_25394/m.57414 type:complete len:121 (-) Transcript_25394:316-678(-)